MLRLRAQLFLGMVTCSLAVYGRMAPSSLAAADPVRSSRDGSLNMKFGWYRGEGLRRKLIIHGQRVDASAARLRASIPDGYGETGFQATGIIFPTEGCWQVTGEVGGTRATFVTRAIGGAD